MAKKQTTMRTLRERADLSQAELGRLLEPPVSQPVVSQWEAGSRRMPLGRQAQAALVLLRLTGVAVGPGDLARPWDDVAWSDAVNAAVLG